MSSKSSRSKRPRASQAREFSAGGVVVRGDEVVVIVPTRRAADGSRVLALPKGLGDAAEPRLQAPQREGREEPGAAARRAAQGGVRVEAGAGAGRVSAFARAGSWRWMEGQTIGKTVSFYL